MPGQPDPRERTYLGDGAYAETAPDTGDLRLFTSNGAEITNSVYLGPHEFEALVRFVKTQPHFFDAIQRAMA